MRSMLSVKSVFLGSIFVAGSFAAAQSGCSADPSPDNTPGDGGADAAPDRFAAGDAASDAPVSCLNCENSWCSTHVDNATLFCNDFDRPQGELALTSQNPPGPWSSQQQGDGGFLQGLSTTCMPNSTPSSFNVTAQVLPVGVSTLDQLVATVNVPTTLLVDSGVNSPTGVILTFDLHVEDYYSTTQDIGIARVGTHADNPQDSPWWVSLDYDGTVMRTCEYDPATALGCGYTLLPDFTVVGWYHCTLAVDLILGNYWWVLDPATSTLLVDAGSDSGDAAVGEGTHVVLHQRLEYFVGLTYPTALSDAGTAMDVIIGLNYAINLGSQTGLYYDNVRVEAVPPEGLPTGPTFPDP